MDYFSLTVGFLVGTATGAASTYFGNKYTDQRRKKELKQEKDYFFEQLWQSHNLLLSEMRDDIKSEQSHHYRKFFALTKSKKYHLKKGEHLVYYTEEHENLIEQLNIFVANGLITDITQSSQHANQYQLNEQFVEHLRSK
nr:hypothetical protein [uncultured Amphritea sp.]